VRFLTDQTAAVTDTYTDDAFGFALRQTVSTANNYRYAGEQNDPDLGLYYLRARYYSPQIGRFWTMDKYEGNNQDPLSLHKYLYSQANPVNQTDPSGHITVKSKTPRPLSTTAGSYGIEWTFTLDKAPDEDGYIVQEVDLRRDERGSPLAKHYWEAWFVPASQSGTPPSVADSWNLDPSYAMKGTGHSHTKIKFFFKRNTGNLGDYRTPPAKPDPKTGWHPGDGKTWSIDLPWTEDRPDWWKNPCDNGEKEASINLDTAWEYEAVNSKISTPKFQTIDVTPLSLFGL
jgi:RHS repeat-associated protein